MHQHCYVTFFRFLKISIVVILFGSLGFQIESHLVILCISFAQ